MAASVSDLLLRAFIRVASLKHALKAYYSSSWYGSELWSLTNCKIADLFTAWRKKYAQDVEFAAAYTLYFITVDL
jgi:hypothetical protein